MEHRQQGSADRRAVGVGIAVAALASLVVLAVALGGSGDGKPQAKTTKTTAKEKVLGVTVTRPGKARTKITAADPPTASTTTTSAAEATGASNSPTSGSGTRSPSNRSSGTGVATNDTIITTSGTVVSTETVVPTTAAPLPPAGRVNERSDNTVAFNTRPASGPDIGTAITVERQEPNWFGFSIDAPRRHNGTVLTAIVSNTNEETLTFPGGLAITFNITGPDGVVTIYTVRDESITRLDAYTQLQVEQFITLPPGDYTMNATTIVDYP